MVKYDFEKRSTSTKQKGESHEVARQTFWYLFAGGSCALLELLIFEGLYSFAGCAIATANVIAVFVATVVNFVFNRSVTFKSASNPIRSAVLYVLLFLANLAISTFGISALISAGVCSVAAKVIMQVLIACWNFVLYRKVVFT